MQRNVRVLFPFRLPCQSSSPSNEKIVWLKDGVPLDKFGSDVDSRIEVASDNTLTIRSEFTVFVQ